MVWIENSLWCDGCGVEITWAPVMDKNRYYCCLKCRDGEECDCAQEQEMEDDRQERSVSPTSMTSV
jgi:hypothetical protein